MHEFLITRSDNNIIMKVRSSCHVGSLLASPLSVVESSQSCILSHCYADHLRPLAAEKLAHMLQMYSKFVPPDCWPRYLPPVPQTSLGIPPPTVSSNPGPSQVSHPSSTNQIPIPRAKKANKCSTRGCDGSGHKN